MPAQIRRGAVVVLAAFLLGAILLQWPMLHPLLFGSGPITRQALDRADRYYLRWWNAPSAVKTLLHTDMAALLVALVSKFAEWTEQAFFFDGACLCTSMLIRYNGLTRAVAAVCLAGMYIAVVVPGLQQSAGTPISSDSFLAYVSGDYGNPQAKGLPIGLTGDAKDEAAPVVAAGVVIIAALLVFIIVLQAGEFYAVEIVDARAEIEWRKQIAAKQSEQRRIQAAKSD